MEPVTERASWDVAWNDELSVGIPRIDEEHRRFLRLIDQLNAAISGRASKARVERLLDDIYLDVKSHFANEERMFAERGFPEAARHAQIHSGLLVQIHAALQDLHETEWSRFWVETGLAVKKLLLDHLLEEDLRYRDYFQSSAVASRAP